MYGVSPDDFEYFVSAFMAQMAIFQRSHPPHLTGDHMHKLRTTAVVLAAFGSLGFLGAGTAYAGGHDGGKGDEFQIRQTSDCKSHDANLDILGEVGLLNGLGGDLLNGAGNSGAEQTSLGSTMGCNNSAFK
jgi:hypothetical protein